MSKIQKITAGGAIFKQLIQFVEECKEKKIPLNTPVKISQHKDRETLYDVVDMQANEESIVFYDWL